MNALIVVIIELALAVIILTVFLGIVFKELAGLKAELTSYRAKTVQEMTQEEFTRFCRHKNLTDEEIGIADAFLRRGLKGDAFYEAIGYSERQAIRKRKAIREKLNK